MTVVRSQRSSSAVARKDVSRAPVPRRSGWQRPQKKKKGKQPRGGKQARGGGGGGGGGRQPRSAGAAASAVAPEPDVPALFVDPGSAEGARALARLALFWRFVEEAGCSWKSVRPRP